MKDLERGVEGLRVNGAVYGTEKYGWVGGRLARSPHLVAKYPSIVCNWEIDRVRLNTISSWRYPVSG